MKIQSALLTAASGSIGGMTASHNKGGLYLRGRTIPTNPNSPEQQAVRSNMAYLTAYWRTTLTQSQRDTWAFVAGEIGIIDSLGQTRFMPPLAYFCRSNAPRLQAGMAVIAEPSGDIGVAELSNLSASASEASQEISIAFNTSDLWVDETGSGLLVLVSRPQNPTINFFKGPYRFADKVLGDDTTPPTSPAAMDVPFPITEGQRVFFQGRATEAGSNLSYPFRGFCVCAA